MGQGARIRDTFPRFRRFNGFFKHRQANHERGQYLAGFIMQFTRNTLAFLLLRVNNLAGALARGIIQRLQYHIERARQLVRLRINARERRSQQAFSQLHAPHHLAQVH